MYDQVFSRRIVSTVLAFSLTLGLSGCNDVSSSSAPAPPPSTNSSSPGGPLSISTSSLPAGTVGQAYSVTVAGSGGTPPYTWLVTPSLPTGLTFDATTGAITGSPSPGTVGTTSFSFVLQDDAFQSVTKVLAVVVNAAPLAIATASLPTGTVNQIYPGTTLVATGGDPPYVWFVNPALPNGLVLNVLSPGTISGVPLAGSNGTTSHTFTVTDSTLPLHQAISTTLSLTITLTVTPVTIATVSLPNGKVGQPYNFTLQGLGGTLPYSWSTNPALPQGLTLNASTGAIAGTPTGTSNAPINITVRDSTAPLNQVGTKQFTLQVTN